MKQAADAGVRGKSTGERFAAVARDMEAIVENGYVIIGSPDEVAEQLREVATQLNVGHLMLLLQYGNMSKDLTRYNTKLFAEQVMPKLKDLHAGWTTIGGRSRWRPRQRAEIPAYQPQASPPNNRTHGAERERTSKR